MPSGEEQVGLSTATSLIKTRKEYKNGTSKLSICSRRSLTNKGDIGGTVSEHHPTSSLASWGSNNNAMRQPPKIYMIDRDRALEVMWYLDSIYDEFKSVKFEDVKSKITQKEWMITQMYFNN